MILAHISDLHLGMHFKNISFIDDQKIILNDILTILIENKADGLIIAGDIYDTALATNDAISLFNDFLNKLYLNNIKVYMIAGNHDNGQRVSFGNELLVNSNIYISNNFENTKDIRVVHEDDTDIYLLPFIKPLMVKKYYDLESDDYNHALKIVIDNLNIDHNKKNILVAHQFITNALRCDSEDITIGGLDNVDAGVFDDFDYVALGHLHRPQNITDKIRYSGSILKYSFSERNDHKSITFIDTRDFSKSYVELNMIHDFIQIKGYYNEIMDDEDMIDKNAYLHIILKDEKEIPYAYDHLEQIFPNLMVLSYEHKQYNAESVEMINDKADPIDIVADFYKMLNNETLDDKQEVYLKKMIEKVWNK